MSEPCNVPFEQRERHPDNFPIEPNKFGGWNVIRLNPKRLVIFETDTESKAKDFLGVYLTLTIENRRKLRSACA